MTTIKVWVVLIILVVLQNNVLKSCFETHTFRFSKWISCIIFRYWNSFSARRSIQFRYSYQLRKCFQLWELCFVPPNRTKIGWKDQRLHCHLIRVDIQFHLFFIIFGCISSFGFGNDFSWNRISLLRCCVSFPATSSLEAENTEIFSHVSYLLVYRTCFDNFLTSLTANYFCLKIRTKMLWLVPCIGNLENWCLVRIFVAVFSIETLLFPPNFASF